MRVLDLFCGAGGASMGLHRAGFDVTGIDLRPQPRYPFRFVQADATRPPVRLDDFDFVWASPPCQRWTAMVQQKSRQDHHPDLIGPVRAMLAGLHHCIENVPRAPLRPDLTLTAACSACAPIASGCSSCPSRALPPNPVGRSVRNRGPGR